jgi:hypothetical protein
VSGWVVGKVQYSDSKLLHCRFLNHTRIAKYRSTRRSINRKREQHRYSHLLKGLDRSSSRCAVAISSLRIWLCRESRTLATSTSWKMKEREGKEGKG